jgi:hypothetical protein
MQRLEHIAEGIKDGKTGAHSKRHKGWKDWNTYQQAWRMLRLDHIITVMEDAKPGAPSLSSLLNNTYPMIHF